jgi:hypothetical protein
VKLRVKSTFSKDLEAAGDRPTGGHRVAEVNLFNHVEIGAWRAPVGVARGPSISFFQLKGGTSHVNHEKGSGCISSCPKRR